MGKENVEPMIEIKFILDGVAQLPKEISVWEDSLILSSLFICWWQLW